MRGLQLALGYTIETRDNRAGLLRVLLISDLVHEICGTQGITSHPLDLRSDENSSTQGVTSQLLYNMSYACSSQ
jgi:hypothetical protein